MPALLPPSMQIGALPPGYGPGAVVGPVRTPQSNPTPPFFIQSAGATTNVSGPTNISQAVTATKVGSTLVWCVAVNASAAAALGGTPAGGWSLVATQAVATLAVGLYILQSNVGAISSVTFSSNATATTGGIASWFWEIDGVYGASATVSNSANGSSAAPASGNATPKIDSNIVLGFVAWVLGTATLSAPTGGWSTTNAQQSSTNGTTNAALETFSQVAPFGTPGAIAMGATLSVSSVWAAGLIGIPSSVSGQFAQDPTQNGQFRLDQGAGYAAGGSWGPTGLTKPGGAGSGQ